MLRLSYESFNFVFPNSYGRSLYGNHISRYARHYSSGVNQDGQIDSKKQGLKLYEDPFNATSTLPIHIRSKAEIFESLKDRAIWKKWFVFGREILGFYKEGIRNVLANRKHSRYLMKSKYCVTLINFQSTASNGLENGSGKVFKSSIKNPHDLTHYLSNELYLRQIKDAACDKEPNKLKLTNITRSEYQLILRTYKDIRKLPVFGLLFLIFEELTPFVCYFFPQLIPTTCMLPSILKKEEMKKLKMTTKDSKELFFKFFRENSLYTLKSEDLKFLSKYFGLSTFSRISDTLMLKSLENYRAEILLDNYLIGDNVDKLNHLELILAGNKRALIDPSIISNQESFLNGNGYDKGIKIAFLRESLKKNIEETKYKL